MPSVLEGCMGHAISRGPAAVRDSRDTPSAGAGMGGALLCEMRALILCGSSLLQQYLFCLQCINYMYVLL